MILVTACLLAAAGGTGAAAQRGETWQYFPDTGHTVSGDFWAYYRGVSNASLVFGSPITEQFTDNSTGRLVQYFQRVRFEYHGENPAGQRVVLSSIGAYVLEKAPFNARVSPPSTIGCRLYPETGHWLCYSFLEFFDRSGGEAIFGKPLSDYIFYGDRIVQYFERARLDYYPEYPEGQKVVPAQLGRIYFDLIREDPNRLQPLRTDNAPDEVTGVQVRAFTQKALTGENDQQQIYVVVQDQTLKPVSGATAVISIDWSQGGQQSIAQNTNDGGVVILPVPVNLQTPGSLVVIHVEVIFSGLSAHTITSFRIRP